MEPDPEQTFSSRMGAMTNIALTNRMKAMVEQNTDQQNASIK